MFLFPNFSQTAEPNEYFFVALLKLGVKKRIQNGIHRRVQVSHGHRKHVDSSRELILSIDHQNETVRQPAHGHESKRGKQAFGYAHRLVEIVLSETVRLTCGLSCVEEYSQVKDEYE
jgi:hypothetical protein